MNDLYEKIWESIGKSLQTQSKMILWIAERTLSVKDYKDFIDEFTKKPEDNHDESLDFIRKEGLKEQDPVEPELEGGGSTWWHVCGECHGAIDVSDNFCKHCGRRIKHEKKAE